MDVTNANANAIEPCVQCVRAHTQCPAHETPKSKYTKLIYCTALNRVVAAFFFCFSFKFRSISSTTLHVRNPPREWVCYKRVKYVCAAGMSCIRVNDINVIKEERKMSLYMSVFDLVVFFLFFSSFFPSCSHCTVHKNKLRFTTHI